MLEDFETVCFELFKPAADGDTLTVFDPLEQFDPQAEEHADIARSLNDAEHREKLWSVFFPEAVGIYTQPQQAVNALRQKRIVVITRPHPEPIRDPAAEILFTSNVLLTLPNQTQPLDQLPLSTNLKKKKRMAPVLRYLGCS